MVLGNASSDSEPMADGAMPESGSDQYASIRTITGNMLQVQLPPNELFIPYDQLKKPFSGVFFRSGSPQAFEDILRKRVSVASKYLKRPVRQDEAEALAANTAQASFVGSIGEPLAWVVATGLWLLKPGRMTFAGGWRPGKEGSRFDVNRFGFFQGRPAQLMWKGAAFSSHVLAWNLIMAIVFVPYAVTTMAVHDLRDPRLREYTDAMRTAKNDATQSRNAEKGATAPPLETFEQRQQRMRIQNAGRQHIQQDDMSPTGGQFASELSTPDFVTDDFVASGDTQSWQERSSTRSTEGAVRAQEQLSARTQQRSPPPRAIVDDLASDVKPTTPAGSAWDRLRQDAMKDRSDKK